MSIMFEFTTKFSPDTVLYTNKFDRNYNEMYFIYLSNVYEIFR